MLRRLLQRVPAGLVLLLSLAACSDAMLAHPPAESPMDVLVRKLQNVTLSESPQGIKGRVTVRCNAPSLEIAAVVCGGVLPASEASQLHLRPEDIVSVEVLKGGENSKIVIRTVRAGTAPAPSS
jgi:hypothetical protein